jgi:formylglycine-generating enzyme required for sulfatase activity
MFFKFLFMLIFVLLGNLVLMVPARSVEIPLEKKGGVYVLPVRINGVLTLNFIVDSGAAEVCIPADVVLTLVRSGTIADSDFLPGQDFTLADGTVLRSPRFIIRELELGGKRITNVSALVVPVQGDLLLGQSLLERLDAWTLDNKRHVFIIETPKISSDSMPSGIPDKKGDSSRSGSETDTWREPITGMEFVWVPGGCFQMGCGPWVGECYVDQVPMHEVCLDGFWMGKFEVTQGEWKKIMGKNPSHFNKGDDYPVEQVSWNSVKAFIERLNGRNGGKLAFRLPTEAEWEYACRSGGRPEKYAGGQEIGDYGWYAENSGDLSHPVGKKAPNGLGLYDMTGNVWEWCEDFYAWDAYTRHSGKNPLFLDSSVGAGHVFRGGSWNTKEWNAQSVIRKAHMSTHRSLCVGFRLVRMP